MLWFDERSGRKLGYSATGFKVITPLVGITSNASQALGKKAIKYKTFVVIIHDYITISTANNNTGQMMGLIFTFFIVSDSSLSFYRTFSTNNILKGCSLGNDW